MQIFIMTTEFLNFSHKKIFTFFCVILFLFPSISTSQQLPLHNQYVYNPLIINPGDRVIFYRINKDEYLKFNE